MANLVRVESLQVGSDHAAPDVPDLILPLSQISSQIYNSLMVSFIILYKNRGSYIPMMSGWPVSDFQLIVANDVMALLKGDMI